MADILDDQNNLQPVPVKLYNYKSSGTYNNGVIGSSNLSGLKLVRRFFLYDILSTQPANGGNPTVVRIADYISLRLGLENSLHLTVTD